uniref:uncharacterized protein LOC122591870 n=1 Tax=Erigeron canadensis TaxID=72917 RepID=UPI001CB9AE04|nr:uncharacterized protein LOC122591870 [Erigeron canadensis]
MEKQIGSTVLLDVPFEWSGDSSLEVFTDAIEVDAKSSTTRSKRIVINLSIMETLQDLIEEAKLRTVWWGVCIFIVTYVLTHTSKSMWMNVPIAILLVAGIHILLTEVDFRWKNKKSNRQSYLSHLEKKQMSVNDSRLSTLPPPPKWKRKIDSPIVEAALDDFVHKLLQEFVVDMWYSGITPDKEAPKLLHTVIMDILAEISIRVKDINLVDLLTRDVVDLVGDHLELFRKNHIAIGREVMVTLSSEERDERLKHHLMASKELHPALISPESEYKFLKRVMGALLAAVLRPREAQCPLVRCIARELLTCTVMEPVMRFASPGQVNELIEAIFLAKNNKGDNEEGNDQSSNVTGQTQNQPAAANNLKSVESASLKTGSSSGQKSDEKTQFTLDDQKKAGLNPPGTIVGDLVQDESVQQPSSAWARVLEAATQRRTEVLQPENLENMWTKGRNYKKKAEKKGASEQNSSGPNENSNDQQREQNLDGGISCDQSKPSGPSETVDENSNSNASLERSNSALDLNNKTQTEPSGAIQVGGLVIPEFYNANVGGENDVRNANTVSDKVTRTEGYIPKLRCRVLGAYFENLDSNPFAVYSIAVTDVDNKTWFVKRRYRNFERLHRQLKDIPNYSLHLPPKRIFSSSTEDAFVHQRCIQLDKYLQDLLSIANIAEQHEVWDFLSMSSKSYSFGRSSSVVKTLAVNVDDAVDDIVRQFKGVSGGLKRKVVAPGSPSEASGIFTNKNVSLKSDEAIGSMTKQTTSGSANSFSDYEGSDKDGTLHLEDSESANEQNLDNDLKSKDDKSLELDKKMSSEDRSEILGLTANLTSTSGLKEDPLGVPAEWAPPNVSVPLLNLVDKIFQLKRRGWLRRQVFWISKQILQLMMEDAIDDWLLRQIHWLRRDNVVAQGIHWVQDILWPEGTFFLKLRASQTDSVQSNDGSLQNQSGSKNNKQGSFEEQLEAARRASDIKKMIFKGAPTTLVSLIGHKQYKRCAKDVYYFLQSAVCLKQLGYGLLELALITVFPELQDIILDVHEKKKDEKV